ncbi:MAG: PDZ domain-containing protein [Planctomycetota bacterium]|nr:PDZ domain-containing protein [Planctomycetota bacterium]
MRTRSRTPARSIRFLAAGLLGLLALGLPGVARAEEGGEKLRQAVAYAKQKVYPCLVNIGVVAKQFRQGRETRGLGAGSGVIVSPAGHVVTNFHVAGEASRITCKLPSGESIDADIVCRDPLTDLCVLKLRMDQRRDPNQPIPFATVGDSTSVRVGEHVMAMGNPGGLTSTVTLGIVSNTARVFTNFTGSAIQTFDFGGGQLTGIFNQWIQHDALILPGNSGGPLVSLKGEVIGINTRGGSGTGFAVPASTVKKVLAQALTWGEVRRGWLGMSIVPVNHLDRDKGALVSSVFPGGPADKAGIKPGDIVTRIDNGEIAVVGFEGVPLFLSRVADLRAGKSVAIEYERKGDLNGTEVVVAPMEKYVGDEKAFRTWGVSAQDITKPMAFARRYPDTDGVLLSTMRPGSAPDKAKPALQSGDVVLAIGGKPVTNLEDFGKLMQVNSKSKALPVRFRRGKMDMVTVLDMSKPPRPPRNTELAKAWMGISTQVLTTKVATALGMEGVKGFRVTRIMPGTEAEKSDLAVGDVITSLNGKALDAYRLQDGQILTRMVEDLDIGGDAKLEIMRGGKTLEISVTLEETPNTSADARTAEDPVLEFKVRELTFIDRVNRDLDKDYRGIMVAAVTPGSWAQVANLRAGDILLEINDQPVDSIRSFKKLVREMGKAKPKTVKIFVRRGRSTAFVFMRPEWPRD